MKKILACIGCFFLFLFVFANQMNSFAAYEQTESLLIREEEKKIIADDPYTKGVDDIVNISSILGTTTAQLIEEGYKSLHITVKFRAKEIDDGYQEIYLYDGASSSSRKISTTIFELTPGKKQTNYSYEEHYLTCKLSEIKSDMVCIRWGAHGKGNDDWLCASVRVLLSVI
ncbi:MAG: hypothetical protein K2I42_06435 [Anaeroplasmataceae bacterium]|nr:hypothetical protein [Anaeroplasmataceae bacterium]